MKVIFKHLLYILQLAFVQVNMRKKEEEKKHKTVEHCASSPTEPVFDFCLYLFCKKGISLYIQFENALELHHCIVCMCACH